MSWFSVTQTISHIHAAQQNVATVEPPPKRPFTVRDSIRMTRLVDQVASREASSTRSVALFSPDGKQFALVLRKGNLELNINEYSLLVFQSADAFRLPVPQTLVTLASSSNGEAIKDVRWLNDSKTLVFLGERAHKRTQLYSVECSSKLVKQLTHHPTNVVKYAISSNGDQIVYVAEGVAEGFSQDAGSTQAISVSNELLSDLILGRIGGGPFSDHSMFLVRYGSGRAARIPLHGRISSPLPELSLSPDSKYLAVRTEIMEVPENWSQYDDNYIRMIIRNRPAKGTPTRVFRYELVDLRSGVSQVLLNAPLNTVSGADVAWSSDSKALVMAGVYLPIDSTDPIKNELRRTRTFIVEVRIPGKEIVEITDDDLKLLRWETRTNLVECEVGRVHGPDDEPIKKIYFRKVGATWEKAQDIPSSVSPQRPEILLDEDMNSPPQVVAVDPKTLHKTLLLDLNPEFKQLTFGKVEPVNWKDAVGHDIKGGLYFPVNFTPTRKYPLIIQTHGFDPNEFWVDGPWTTAFAAQPLANRDFFVLQVSDPDFTLSDTPEEPQRAMAAYESAVDHLSGIGLIDSSRLALVGFSRSCLYVKYTLTHSKYHFSAAIAADGIDAGYFQYVAFSNAIPTLASEFEALNAALPIDDGFAAWLRLSSGFLVNKVDTPLQIQAIGPVSLVGEWEWFSRLSRLHKPVDMIYLAEGSHILQKPWERMASQQGAVDWLAFWLKGEEDPDPLKKEMYARWHRLRIRQSAAGQN